MSVGLWLEEIVVVVSATFPENILMISLWLGRAEAGWEAWGLFSTEATCCCMRARRGGWGQPLVQSRRDAWTGLPTRLPGSPSSLSLSWVRPGWAKR